MNRQATRLVRKGNVDELVKTTWSEEGGVDLVRSVRSADDENVLLCVHTVHFRKDLVQYTVTCTTSFTGRTTARLRDRVQLVKEHHARCGNASLVENVSVYSLLETNNAHQEDSFEVDKIVWYVI